MRDEVYDYIIFRACDIRDLIVDPVQELPENEAFEDPAIVQAVRLLLFLLFFSTSNWLL